MVGGMSGWRCHEMECVHGLVGEERDESDDGPAGATANVKRRC